MEISLGQALILYFIQPVLFIIWLSIIIYVVLSWLISFNVVNPSNQLVRAIWQLTEAIMVPLLRPIRRFLPPLGGFDLSPIVLLLILMFVRNYVFGPGGPVWNALG